MQNCCYDPMRDDVKELKLVYRCIVRYVKRKLFESMIVH